MEFSKCFHSVTKIIKNQKRRLQDWNPGSPVRDRDSTTHIFSKCTLAGREPQSLA